MSEMIAASETALDAPLTGPEKAALVVLGLDEEVAVQILRALDEDDLRRLAEVVERFDPIPTDKLLATLEEFEAHLGAPAVPKGGKDYVRRLTVSAIGQERAERLFAPPGVTQEALMIIRNARTSTVAELLEEEHPQVAAVIVSQLPRDQASAVLLAMPEKRQVDIINRVAALHEVPERAIAIASETLADQLRTNGGVSNAGGAEFDGVSFAAALINEMPTDDSERILEYLEDQESDLAPKIREAMFTFEDLVGMDTRSLQTLMREVSSEQLLISLKTASEMLREKFFAALSQRAAASMREDLELMPPKRLSEVEAAQREIIDAAMQLSSDGKIQLPGGGGEEMV